MFGRQFWPKFNLNSCWEHQLLNFLLLGIAFFFFTLACTTGLVSVPGSKVGSNHSLVNRYAQAVVGYQADEQNYSNQDSKFSDPQQSKNRIIAALEGYDIKVHGFGFENYGDEKPYIQLTSTEVERMFGEQVCVSKVNGECILTSLGEQWMEQRNKSMGIGHCDGMAALSLLFYLNQIKVEDFGGSSVNRLKIEGNEKLQREIAYWWATQATEPTRSARDKNALTPREVVNELVKAFRASHSSEVYTIALWKPYRRGGHAVTPFAIEDRGNGIFAILVYDNNHPNITREIIVDSNADTWKYSTSINPNAPEHEYEGDANTKTLLLTPTSFRLQTQVCPFCEENTIPLVTKTERVGE